MRRLIKIYDTTLRDGTQGEGVSFSLEDKVRLTSRLDDFGIRLHRRRLARLQSARTCEFFRRMQDVTLKHAKLAAFGMTRRAGARHRVRSEHAAIIELEARRSSRSSARRGTST